MSELRNSTPPVPPMSGDAAPTEATPHVTAPVVKRRSGITRIRAKAAKKPLSAAKASKPTPRPRITESAPTHTDAKGRPTRCQVGAGQRQCANPGRWPHGRGFTCTTHHKAIVAGRSVPVTGKVIPWTAPSKAATA